MKRTWGINPQRVGIDPGSNAKQHVRVLSAASDSASVCACMASCDPVREQRGQLLAHDRRRNV